ncbi:type II toxin-antitoxin system VapC family toxin [Streptomyces antibioticus]|uniref:Ribonuclease VapC n=1 Tax=Streptomyces antibioticus TaxID=1890 RepID=A0AAE6Y9E7_STRAT|nr:type II toxin-antitoxin system VapC family toxin [Streptomyces antibioticus]MCX5170082.1 type II toxin-antitoxin system VapC family toxin [Streptomyces antibioticus]OOQ50016.1 plasmid stabilization protein [Streptomyces antibioticus]QIT45430.1 type II toxin-antitoxin system VapC family toxin [Streptomyces antibioticus]
MIILDTNILSELVKPAPEQRVVEWLDSLAPDEVVTTAVTAAELWYGVRRLPDGKRKSELADGIDAMLFEDLGGRIEVFDAAAATRYADIVLVRESLGRPIAAADAQIAAICARHRATLATRNVKDFEDTGVPLVNPWDDASAARG